MNEQRRQAAVAKERAAIRFAEEQAERTRQAALEQQRREEIARANAEAKERARLRQLALLEQSRLARERQGEAMLRTRAERARLSELSEQWREVNGATNNMAWAGWRTITGQAMESHAGWIRLRTKEGDVCLTNLPVELADGESVEVKATHVGLHRYNTQLGQAATGAGITIRKYDCGRPCPPPVVWLASAKLREAEEARLRAEEDALTRAAQEQTRADAEAFERAQAAEVEKEREHYLKQQAAFQARTDATTLRVIAYQHQQASNGYPSFQYELGKRYLSGDGVRQDKVLATHWLKSACTNGLSEATNLLAKVPLMLEFVTDSK